MSPWDQRKWEQKMWNVLEEIAATLMWGWVSSTTETFSPTATKHYIGIHLSDLEELKAEVVGRSLTVESKDLGRVPTYTCGCGQVSQTHGTSVVLAVKQDKEFMPSLKSCVAPMK